jgi:hypothetical protein
MNEEVPIVPFVVGAFLAVLLGYEINRRRNKLRKIFNTFSKEESEIAVALKQMVESGRLRPHASGQAG